MDYKKSLQSVLTKSIFLASFFIGVVVSITVLFPTLIIRVFGGLEDYSNINDFETGLWTYHWVCANTALIITAVLYKKNKLPSGFNKFFAFVLNFDVSAKIAFVVIAVILSIYVPLSAHEIFEEEVYEDYKRGGKETIENWQPSDITKSFTYHVRQFLDYTSIHLFGNYKVVPFIASISLLVLTYYTAKELTKKRFCGLVALVLVLQSGTFLIYDTSLTYDNYWILFYLLSLYVILKSWPLSPISFILSILSKHLSVVFVPMTLFFAYNASISRKNKILLTISYAGIFGIGFFVTSGFGTESLRTSFDWHDYWMALSGISYQLRYDGLILVFLLPVLIWSFIVYKKGVNSAQTTTVLILGSLLSQPMLAALTIDSSEPYRFMPLVVFFAIACSVLFSKTKVGESV